MKDSSARISVVIPTYNYGHFLPQAIESARTQTVPPLEIWVADDGSTDRTAEVVARYGEAVKYRRFEHCGVYGVRQAMLDVVRGEWFLNLDADNWIEPDFLEKAWAAIQAHPADDRLAFVYPDILRFGQGTQLQTAPEFDATLLKQKNYLDMNCLIRTGVARQFGFDPAFNAGQGDYDFFLTLVENGFVGRHFSGSPLHYRTHGSSITQVSFRRLRQREITRRMLAKHRKFFTPVEARAARASADNRTLVALIGSRSPFAGLGRRLSDWALFARVGCRHAEFRSQTLYTMCPQAFLARQEPPADVYFLFRDTPERRHQIRQVLGSEATGLEGGQLFGYEELRKSGLSVDCNLRFPRLGSVRQTIQDWKERGYAPKTGVGLGDICSVRAHLGQLNRARVVLATSDNTGLPAVRLKVQGRLKAPLVYVSIGLPERLQALEARCPTRAKRYRKRLARVDLFVAYGHAEAEWLRKELGNSVQVRFIPFGVDSDKWQPQESAEDGPDVLSIGADPMRDFGLLVEYARQRPDRHICMVTRPVVAETLGSLPANLCVRVDVPIDELRTLISASKTVVLPVKENTYSGATTTLLQCMAMGKPVAVSRVGAIRDGYGFEDGKSLRFMESGSQESLNCVIDGLLADAGLRAKLGNAARANVVETLGWDRYVREIQGCLAEFLKSGERK